ncbi:MAG: hypothetical protein DI619_00425 [Francisella sp.]|nr:MAG: hypothetical protein DI619_00425 [Francisella sp.]
MKMNYVKTILLIVNLFASACTNLSFGSDEVTENTFQLKSNFVMKQDAQYQYKASGLDQITPSNEALQTNQLKKEDRVSQLVKKVKGSTLHQRYQRLRLSGIASWYGKGFHGRKTASGQKYNMYKLTAAHRKLPLHTKIEVTNLKNARKVILEVNDRGPYDRRRILDVSYAAAKKLGFVQRGAVPVHIKIVSQPRRRVKLFHRLKKS